MANSSEGWFSLPASARFAGASEQPRPPAPTVAGWPPPPAQGSAPPPPPSGVRAVAQSIYEMLDSDLLEEAEPAFPTKPDPIARLLEDVGDLELFGTVWQAAAFCAAVLVKSLGARAVIIHALDERASELRVIGVAGARTTDLLGEIAAVDDDLVGATVASNGRPMTMFFDGELPRIAPARLSKVGAKHSLVAVPLMTPGGCVAVIEVIDAAETCSAMVTEACGHVAERMLGLLPKRAR